MIQEAIHEVIEGQDLVLKAAREVLNEIMSGETTPAPDGSIFNGSSYERRDHR